MLPGPKLVTLRDEFPLADPDLLARRPVHVALVSHNPGHSLRLILTPLAEADTPAETATLPRTANGVADRRSRIGPPAASRRPTPLPEPDRRYPWLTRPVEALPSLLVRDTEANAARPTSAFSVPVGQILPKETDHSLPLTVGP